MEQEHHELKKTMTKEALIAMIKKAKCDMLEGLPLQYMSKEDIVEHLADSCCPELRKLVKKQRLD